MYYIRALAVLEIFLTISVRLIYNLFTASSSSSTSSSKSRRGRRRFRHGIRGWGRRSDCDVIVVRTPATSRCADWFEEDVRIVHPGKFKSCYCLLVRLLLEILANVYLLLACMFRLKNGL